MKEGDRTILFPPTSAVATETYEDYLNKRGIEKGYCQKMVEDLLKKQNAASRKAMEGLLLSKLSAAFKTKKNFITNLLQDMRRKGIIQPMKGKRGKGAKWELCKLPSKRNI